jgi:hypothetical protein
MQSKFKTYYIIIAGKYLTTVYEKDGQITQTIQHPHQEQAAIWTYAEATNLCARLVNQTGEIDFCEMVEAIEQDEYEAEDDRDEHQKRADAQAEYADDSRDDR